MGEPRKQGEFLQADYFDNVGGLNVSDSPFRVLENQATAGANYDYVVTGGFRKRSGHSRLNSSADGVLPTTGVFVHTDNSNTKTLLRATSTVLQTINKTTGASTTVSNDEASPASAPFTSTQPVVFSQFNTTSNIVTWMAGGGQASGVVTGYNGTSYTNNGAAAPTSSGMSASTTEAGTQALATGTYYYSVALVKAATGSVSNAAMDIAVSVTNGATKGVKLTFNFSPAIDQTKYSHIRVYRSVISGVTSFTAGDLVETLASSATTSSIDLGAVAAAGATAVPRAGSIILDNSVLPAGTYNTIASYRRRLVTAQGSTLYFSDLNKPESWPTNNTIQIASGGPITAIGVINFNTPATSDITELLVVFKERECWLVQGNNFTTYTDPYGIITRAADVSLLFGDFVGCVAQPLIVNANGYIYWIDYRGVYLWNGSGKPIYCSGLIEYDFTSDGDIDLSNLVSGIGTFLGRQNQIYWFISSKTYGVQKMVIKLDLRLTLKILSMDMVGNVINGVFAKDTLTYNVYGAYSAIISAGEILYSAGNEGRIWTMYDNLNSDGGSAIAFSYRTKPLELGMLGTIKRVVKVIAWCQEGNTNNLTLNFWVNYRTLDQYKGTVSEQITTQVTTAVWDQSMWDVSSWDAQYRTYAPVVFNIASPDIGTEGEAITLEFQQQDLNSPVIIAGFSVIYSTIGVRQ